MEVFQSRILYSREVELDALSSMLYSTMGFILIERNHIEEGLKLSVKGYEISRKSVSVAFKGYGALLMAESLYKVEN